MKSPAFQFYPDDFLGSPNVRAMTTQEIGAYLLLLCLDWNGKGFVYDEEELSRATKLTPAEFVIAWKRISRCFVAKNGRLFNPRLRVERAKQREWKRKSSKGGKIGAAKRWAGRDKGGHEMVMPNALPNDDSPFPSPTPDSTTTTKAKHARRPASRPSWLEPIGVAWESFKGEGSFKHAKAGGLLKRLHDSGKTGEEIAANLRRYLLKTDAQFASLARFAETFADHNEFKLAGPPIVDGWLSPELDRLTRPAGYVA